MSKSAIYLASGAVASVPADTGIIPLGTTVRRLGCDAIQAGDGAMLRGGRYYQIAATAVVSSADAGTASIQLVMGGQPVFTTEVSQTLAAGSSATLSINAIVKTPCCDNQTSLSLQNTGIAVAVTDATLYAIEL